jgi:hypothetical protein
MGNCFILHSNEGIHLIASNFRVVYMALQDMQDELWHYNFMSYSYYCRKFDVMKDVMIPRKNDNHFTISKRPILSKYIKHPSYSCAIPFDTKNNQPSGNAPNEKTQ